MVKANLLVRGHVQGVFFRANTKKKAEELRLEGKAENLEDGSVRITAQGPKEDVDKLVEYCINGTEHGHVEDVDINYSDEEDEELEGFRVN